MTSVATCARDGSGLLCGTHHAFYPRSAAVCELARDEAPVTQFCVCDEEWCWCHESIEVPFRAAVVAANGGASAFICEQCRAGHHVMSPDGPRS